MSVRCVASSVLFVLMGLGAGSAAADIVCPDSSYTVVDFACTYSGGYRNGEAYDYVTVVPDGTGETFAATGITILVYLKNCDGTPIVGLPAELIQLQGGSLCICPGGNQADGPTDANGCARFSGTLRAGGWAGGVVAGLTVVADGVTIGTIPVKINSPDVVATPCTVDLGDDAFFQAFRTAAGDPRYNIGFDFNEDGFVDLADLAIFTSHLGARCP